MLTRLYLPNWWEQIVCNCLFRPNLSLSSPRHADVVDALVVFRARWSMADGSLKISNPVTDLFINIIEILA